MAELIDKGALYEKMTDEYLTHYAGDVASSFTIAMQMVQNQPTVTEAEIRAKAYDRFAKALKQKYPIAECGFGFINDKLHENIDKIAEQLKEET
jgi:hypothetical protein